MKRSVGARKSGRALPCAGIAGALVIAGTVVGALAAPARARAEESGAEAAPASRCDVVVVAALVGAPPDRAPGVGATWMQALAAGPEGAAWQSLLAASSARVQMAATGARGGAELHLTLTAAGADEALLVGFAAHAVASFPRSVTPSHPLTPSLADAQAAAAVLFPLRAADADPDSAEARLADAVEGAAVRMTRGCSEPAPLRDPAPTLAPADALPLLRPVPTDDGRPRIFLVLPIPDDALLADIRALSAWLEHPGSAFGRRLAAPPLRLGPVRVTHLEAAAVLVVSAPMPVSGDPRAIRHDLLRLLPSLRPDAVSMRGAARLSGHPAPERQLAGRLAEALLSPERGAVVALPPDPADALDVPTLDAEARDRFVAAAVELRCPAPSDTREAELRLQEKLGLDAPAWRLLAREVAGDPALAVALEQEVVDRCGALARLRRRVSAALFERVYRAHRCEIARMDDEDAAFEAGRRLLAGLGLDSAWLTPILEMADGDPRLERIRHQIDARCPAKAPGDSR